MPCSACGGGNRSSSKHFNMNGRFVKKQTVNMTYSQYLEYLNKLRLSKRRFCLNF